MKFKKIIIDRSNADILCDFMRSIYIDPNTNKPLTITMFDANPMSSNIIVVNDKVISTLVEDRGLSPTEVWNMFTFMDMMDKAGYEMVNPGFESDVRIFTQKDTDMCDACMSDCKYTGYNRHIPVYTDDGPMFVSVRLCPSCSNKFKEEFDVLVDISHEKAKESEDKPVAKKDGLIKRIFNKVFRR